jgi:hypothetical protein
LIKERKRQKKEKRNNLKEEGLTFICQEKTGLINKRRSQKKKKNDCLILG